MQSHTRTIFKHIGQMTWFFTLASMVYSILLSRISKVKSLTIIIIFNTILQMHNIFFTTRKCNIGSSVAGGNAGGKPCYLPFLSITVSSCQGRARGTAGRDKNWFQYFCSTDTVQESRIRSFSQTSVDCNIFFQHEIACTDFPSVIVRWYLVVVDIVLIVCSGLIVGW